MTFKSTKEKICFTKLQFFFFKIMKTRNNRNIEFKGSIENNFLDQTPPDHKIIELTIPQNKMLIIVKMKP